MADSEKGLSMNGDDVATLKSDVKYLIGDVGRLRADVKELTKETRECWNTSNDRIHTNELALAELVTWQREHSQRCQEDRVKRDHDSGRLKKLERAHPVDGMHVANGFSLDKKLLGIIAALITVIVTAVQILSVLIQGGAP